MSFGYLKNNKAYAGFSLIELLSAVAVIAILCLLSFSLVGGMRRQAEKTERVNAIRQLSQGYQLYAQDHRGSVIPGILSTQNSAMIGLELTNHKGIPVTNAAARQRPTFRLLPYVGDIHAFYPGSAGQLLEDVAETGTEDYMVSLNPSFGLNQTYLGGNQQNPRWDHSADTLLKITEAVDPAKLIVFVSSLQGMAMDGGDYELGLFHVNPPNGERSAWTGSYNPEIPANWGFIRLNEDREALVVHLDSSVAFLNEEQLRDMRRWSNRAAQTDNPNYKPSGSRY